MSDRFIIERVIKYRVRTFLDVRIWTEEKPPTLEQVVDCMEPANGRVEAVDCAKKILSTFKANAIEVIEVRNSGSGFVVYRNWP